MICGKIILHAPADLHCSCSGGEEISPKPPISIFNKESVTGELTVIPPYLFPAGAVVGPKSKPEILGTGTTIEPLEMILGRRIYDERASKRVLIRAEEGGGTGSSEVGVAGTVEGVRRIGGTKGTTDTFYGLVIPKTIRLKRAVFKRDDVLLEGVREVEGRIAGVFGVYSAVIFVEGFNGALRSEIVGSVDGIAVAAVEVNIFGLSVVSDTVV